MLRLILVIPKLFGLWRLLQLLDEEEGELNPTPEDIVRRRLGGYSSEDQRRRQRDRRYTSQAEQDLMVRLVEDKARRISWVLGQRGWPEAELQEVVLGEAPGPKRLFRKVRYQLIVDQLVVWPLNEETDLYLGRNGTLYGDYDVLHGVFRPVRIYLMSLSALRQLDRDLDSLRGRLLSTI